MLVRCLTSSSSAAGATPRCERPRQPRSNIGARPRVVKRRAGRPSASKTWLGPRRAPADHPAAGPGHRPPWSTRGRSRSAGSAGRARALGHPADGMLARTGPIAAAPPFGGWSRVHAGSDRTDRRAGWRIGRAAGPASTCRDGARARTRAMPAAGPDHRWRRGWFTSSVFERWFRRPRSYVG